MQQLDKIKSYFFIYKKIVILVIITGLFFDGLMAFVPILQGNAINAYANHEPKEYIYQQVLYFMLLVLFVQINRFFKRYYVRVFANKIMLSMRDQSFKNIMLMDLDKEETKGDILSKNLSDIADTAEGIRKVTTEIFDSLVLLLGYFLVMFFLSIELTIIVSIFIIISISLSAFLKKIIYKYVKAYKQEYSKSKDLTIHLINNTPYYQSLGVNHRYYLKYGKSQDQLEKKSIKAFIFQGSLEPIYYIISLLSLAFVIYFGGNKAIDGGWDIGTFSSYLLTLFLVASKASKVGKMFNAYQKAKVSWVRCKPYLKNINNPKNVTFDNKNYLKMENVEFGFNNELILSHLNFTFTPSMIGITGKIHSGKSTFASLLTGLYQYKGSIIFKSVELSTIKNCNMRNISYSPQSPEVFHDTIKNNILLGRDGDFYQAAMNSCFIETVKKFPNKFDSIISHSLSSLSGGERSRLSIARSILNHPDLIILDDVFSGLDIDMSIEIINNLKRDYQSSIIFIVTNQSELLELMDRVIRFPLDEGKAYER